MIAREDPALPADQSQRPSLHLPAQPEGKEKQDKQPELPPLHFPQRPDGQGLAPAPGGSAPPPSPPTPPPPQWPAPGPQEPPPGPPPEATPWRSRRQPGGPGPGPGRQRGAARPMRPAEQPVRHRAIAGLILSVVSLLSLLGIGTNYHRAIYLVVFAVLVGLTACWFAMTAIRSARRASTMRPRGATAAVVLGGLGALIGALVLVFFAAYWSQLNAFSQCINGANTQSAEQACLNQLHKSVNLGGVGTGR